MNTVAKGGGGISMIPDKEVGRFHISRQISRDFHEQLVSNMLYRHCI